MAVIFYKPFAAPRTTVNITLVVIHFLRVYPNKLSKVINTATVFPSVVHDYCRIEVSVAFMKLVIAFIIVLLIPVNTSVSFMKLVIAFIIVLLIPVNTSVCGIKLIIITAHLVVVCFPGFHVVPLERVLV